MQTIIRRQKTSSHITYNGENCLKVYNQELQNVAFTKMHLKNIQPFDTVILDYNNTKNKWHGSCKRNACNKSTSENNI